MNYTKLYSEYCTINILFHLSWKGNPKLYKRILYWNIITFFKDRESLRQFAVIAIFAIIFIFYRVEVTVWWKMLSTGTVSCGGKCRYIPIYRRRYPSAKLLMVVSLKQFYFWRFSNIMGSDYKYKKRNCKLGV